MNTKSLIGAVCLSLAIVAGAQAGPAVTGDLSVYYSFDDIADFGGGITAILDESGKDHHGQIINSGSFSLSGDAISGKAGLLTGTTSTTHAYLDMFGESWPGADIPTSGFTLAAFAKVDATGDQAIFNARSGPPEMTWLIHPEIKNDKYRYTLRSDIPLGSTAKTTITNISGTDPPPVFDDWVHVAFVYDQAAPYAALYVNGEVHTEGVVENANPMPAAWGSGARVGYNIDDARPFTGLMDEFYIFTRALSPGEIRTLSQVPEPGSIALLVIGLLSLAVWRGWKRTA